MRQKFMLFQANLLTLMGVKYQKASSYNWDITPVAL